MAVDAWHASLRTSARQRRGVLRDSWVVVERRSPSANRHVHGHRRLAPLVTHRLPLVTSIRDAGSAGDTSGRPIAGRCPRAGTPAMILHNGESRDRSGPAHRTQEGLPAWEASWGRLRLDSVLPVVGLEHLGGDPAAVGDLHPALARPVADRLVLLPVDRRAPTPRPTAAATASAPATARPDAPPHELGERVAQLVRILRSTGRSRSSCRRYRTRRSRRPPPSRSSTSRISSDLRHRRSSSSVVTRVPHESASGDRRRVARH